ncbi:MAG: spermidine synthase [Gallionellales bacterium GWA2_59_43]|nr:MAG: spermidine synthase [Gallionellales bacterium GWA2_59_43]
MTISIEIREDSGVRTLHFGSDWVQGAMRIARPWNLELEYTREMMASLLLLRAPPRKVLLIGLGTASLTKFLYRNYPQAHLTIVEIEPAVVAAARQFFKLPEDDKRLHLVIDDGAEYIMHSNKKFDLILVDGFDKKARTGALETLPFYQACRARLSGDGMMAVNMLTRSRGFKATAARITEAFDDRALVFPSCESGNAVALAAAGDPIEITFEELKKNMLELKEATGLNLQPTLTRLAQAKTCLNNTLIL